MGTIDITSLLFADDSSGSAVEIGWIPSVHSVVLTEIMLDDQVDGGYSYGRLIPAELSELVMRSLDDDNAELCIQRMEFKYPAVGDDIQAGCQLVCTEYPYSSFWATFTPFKKGSKGAILPAFETREQMLLAMEDADVDWWDKSANNLTAALPETRFRYFLRKRKRFDWSGRHWVFGVITAQLNGAAVDSRTVETTLFMSDVIQQDIRQTLDGSIRVGKFARRPRIFVRDEANALAWFSIRQALAGPGPGKDMDDWVGQPVVKLARQIYRNHLHTLSERISERKGDDHIDIDHLANTEINGNPADADVTGLLTQNPEDLRDLEQTIKDKITSEVKHWRAYTEIED